MRMVGRRSWPKPHRPTRHPAGLAAAVVLLCAGAVSADVQDFAMTRCVTPMMAGDVPLTTGLNEVPPSVVGARGEMVMGSRAAFFWDGEAPYYMAWGTVAGTIRGCAVNRLASAEAPAPALGLEALMAESGAGFGPVCSGKDTDGTVISLAVTQDRQARGAYVVLSVADGELVVFERAFAAGPCPEENG